MPEPRAAPVSVPSTVFRSLSRTTSTWPAGRPPTVSLRAATPCQGADAHVVACLRAAGVVILGRLNMHEIALGGTTDNPHAGLARAYERTAACDMRPREAE